MYCHMLPHPKQVEVRHANSFLYFLWKMFEQNVLDWPVVKVSFGVSLPSECSIVVRQQICKCGLIFTKWKKRADKLPHQNLNRS